MKEKQIKQKRINRDRRRGKIRSRISGTSDRPRLSVFKSNRGLYIQLIDDSKASTLVSAHFSEIKDKKSKKDLGFELGKKLAEKALAKDIKVVVFDRGGYKYHGRVKALADGAREGGLKF